MATFQEKLDILLQKEVEDVEKLIDSRLSNYPKIVTNKLAEEIFFNPESVQEGGEDEPSSCIRHDNENIYVGLGNGEIRVFSYKKQLKMVLKGHKGAVLLFQIRGNMLISCSADSTIMMWDLKKGECLHTFEGHKGSVTSICFNDKILVSGGTDQTVKVWDLEKKTLLKSLEGHKHWVRSLDMEGDRVISGSYDSTVIEWDLKEMKQVKKLEGHSGYIWGCQYADKFIVSIGSDKFMKVWCKDTGKCILSCVHGDVVKSLNVINHFAVCACLDSHIYFWNLESGKLLKKVRTVKPPYFVDAVNEFAFIGCNDGHILTLSVA